MASKTVSAIRPKDHLTRGIDQIPDDWEFVSCDYAIRALDRALTTLSRLADAAKASGDTIAARELRRTETACLRALQHIVGSFDRAHIEPRAKRWAELVASRGERPRPALRLIVDNSTQVQS